MSMNAPTRILILTASTGMGHIIAARGMRQALAEAAPDAQIEIVDILQWTNRFFRKLYADGYLYMVRHAPALMGVLYDATDRPPGRLDWLRRAFQRANLRSAGRRLWGEPPDLIINTHFLPAEMVATLRRHGQLDCPQAVITTDFETHRMWAQAPAERYYTATQRGKDYLCTWGIDPRSVRATGIPVRAEFERRLIPAEIRGRAELSLDRPVILLLCGGFGVGPTEQLLNGLVRLKHDAQIVAVAGRNDALRHKLETIAVRVRRTVRVVGHTDCMHEWMAAADLVVSKSGGLTVSESLVSGLPMAVVAPIPGPESRNSDYLLEQGAAIRIHNVHSLQHRIDALLADAQQLDRMRRAARRIAPHGAARRIAADVLRLIGREVQLTKPRPERTISPILPRL